MILVPLSLYYSGVVQSKTTGANFRRRKVGKSLSLSHVRKRATSNCDWAFSEGNIVSSLQTCRLKKLNHAQTSFSACLFRAICNSPSGLCIVRNMKPSSHRSRDSVGFASRVYTANHKRTSAALGATHTQQVNTDIIIKSTLGHHHGTRVSKRWCMEE